MRFPDEILAAELNLQAKEWVLAGYEIELHAPDGPYGSKPEGGVSLWVQEPVAGEDEDDACIILMAYFREGEKYVRFTDWIEKYGLPCRDSRMAKSIWIPE